MKPPNRQLEVPEVTHAPQVTKSGVIATLRLLFARQAKGKRKLVLTGFYDNYPSEPASKSWRRSLQSHLSLHLAAKVQSRMTESAEQVYKRALSEMKKEQWLAAIKLLKREAAVVQTNWRFSWNLGWCYFKLEQFDAAGRHMIRAAQLAPENPTCKWGLGNVYLKKKQFKKAQAILTESLRIKESHLTRIALAMAFLSQGKVAEAENVHLEGIRLKPKNSERYESYAAFLSDVGREAEAQLMNKKARKLQRVN